jgi:hypothetical protein
MKQWMSLAQRNTPISDADHSARDRSTSETPAKDTAISPKFTARLTQTGINCADRRQRSVNTG